MSNDQFKHKKDLFQLMQQNGVFNSIQANFISEVMSECSKAGIQDMKSPNYVPNNKANVIASNIVSDFLKRNGLKSTLSVASKETKSFCSKPMERFQIANELDITSSKNILNDICKAHSKDNDEIPTKDTEEIYSIISSIMEEEDNY